MKTPTLISIIFCAIPSLAFADMKPVDATNVHQALSGAHYTCLLAELEFEMTFAEVPLDAREFPYEVKTGNQTGQDAYVVAESGEVKLQSGDAVRYLAFNERTLNVAKTQVGRPAVCTRN